MEENRNLNEQTLYDDYIEDAFTYSDGEVELSVDSIVTGCISSSNNNFSLDENGNLIVNSIAFNGSQQNSLCDIIYPVGSIYMSVNEVSPSILFGGTWEKITNKFLLGAGGSYSLNSTGGATSVTSGASSGSTGGPSTNTTGSTTLTVAQMPSHTHDPGSGTSFVEGGSGSGSVASLNFASGNYHRYQYYHTSATGGGQGHTHTLSSHTHSLNSHTHSVNTMPPYLAVNIWKRTA